MADYAPEEYRPKGTCGNVSDHVKEPLNVLGVSVPQFRILGIDKLENRVLRVKIDFEVKRKTFHLVGRKLKDHRNKPKGFVYIRLIQSW